MGSMVWSLSSSDPLSELQFKQWRELIEARTGMHLPERQKVYLQQQLTARMRELGLAGYDAYYDVATQGVEGNLEWLQLVDKLVIKETHFFRHRPSLDYVRSYLSEALATKRLDSSFEIWSVGCATGEEPYSLAMVANDCFAEAEVEAYFGVTGLDISSPALQVARKAVYSERRTELMTDAERQRYLQKTASGWEIEAGLRSRVCFSQGNVLQLKRMPKVKMDVIFCQNLLIYFRRWRRREILNGLVERLKPGGLLVIGHGEAVDWQNPAVARVAAANVQAYRLTGC